MTWLVNLIWLLALLVYWPVLLYRILWLGKSRHGWGERLGRLPARTGDAPLVWMHAVSLGEVNATRALVTALRSDLPELELAVSTTTDTGMARARELYGSFARVFYFPLDFSWVIRRVLTRLRPSLIVLVELEVWPNLVLVARQMGIPVVVVNGRISERALPRYRLIAPAVRVMMRRLSAVAAQDRAIAERFLELGVPPARVEVLGTMKYDTAEVVDDLPGSNELADALGLPRRSASSRPLVWVAGQTGPGEEAIVLETYRLLLGSFPGLRLVVVPRKPERFEEAAELIRAGGFELVRRSERPNAAGPAEPRPPAGGPQPVVLLDTMGELRLAYTLADVVFVGRTLVPMGGSDVMEVAGLGKPLVVGPYTQNFAEPVRLLREAGGLIQLSEPAGSVQASAIGNPWASMLFESVRNLLAHPAVARQMADQARDVLRRNKGATAAHVALIRGVLGR